MTVGLTLTPESSAIPSYMSAASDEAPSPNAPTASSTTSIANSRTCSGLAPGNFSMNALILLEAYS